MNAQERIKARKSLDKRLNSIRNSQALARPPRGWIKAIRESLGITTKQMGQRMGVSQPQAVQMENGERSSSLTLNSLERAAEALGCRLVYALVPVEPLETMVEERALTLAKKRMGYAAHTMGLEDQQLSEEDTLTQLKELSRELSAKSGSELWEES